MRIIDRSMVFLLLIIIIIIMIIISTCSTSTMSTTITSSSSSSSSSLQTDAQALIAFKNRLLSDPQSFLQEWRQLQDDSISATCTWRGVQCSSAGRVNKLDLTDAGISGPLFMDDILTSLDHLQTLSLRANFFYAGNLSSRSCSAQLVSVDLSQNNFSSILPPDFLSACSTSLTYLNLSLNSFSGAAAFQFRDSLRVLDISHNQFTGSAILEYSLFNCRNLSYLDFSANSLSGELPAGLSNCSSLQTLNLSANLLTGPLPGDFLLSSSIVNGRTAVPLLQVLDLSYNNLSGDFTTFSFGNRCDSLTVVDLSNNVALTGGVSATIQNCHHLQTLNLAGNSLGPDIPRVIGNLLALSFLSLSRNRFVGSIPAELGRACGSLRELDLSQNGLFGGIPASFSGCSSSLESINLGNNQFTSDDVFPVVSSSLTALKILRLPFNNLTGTIPSTLMKCTALQVVDFSANGLTGTLPAGICTALPFLQDLLLSDNYLSGVFPAELSRCRHLRSLDFSFNFYSGEIPSDLWQLPELTDFIFWANNLTGELPANLCKNDGGGSKLKNLILNNNFLTGSIPEYIGGCSGLVWISFASNRLTGHIPSSFGMLQSLAILQLGNNSLSGPIPPEIGNCTNLIWLDVNSNNLTGILPPELANQAGHIVPGVTAGKKFAYLRNEGGTTCRGAGGLFEFSGIRTERLENFPIVHSCSSTRIYTGLTVYTFGSNGSMIILDLSYNSISGGIPEIYGGMPYLQVMNLGHNSLNGTVPSSFGGLRQVGVLDLSHNHLEGFLPGSLGGLSYLSDLDVSNNNLTGPIPSSGQLMTFPASRYENNSGLCGVPLPPCGSRNSPTSTGSSAKSEGSHPSSLIGSIAVGISVSLLLILVLLLVLWRMQKQQQAKEEEEKKREVMYMESLPTSGSGSWKLSGVLEPLSINVATFEKPLRKLTFAHLLDATNGFNADSLIGSGGFGEVYKAELKDGCVVAVKKLLHVTGQGDREFTAEMETIGKIKHRNLVPLLGYCKVGEERLLVYEYMKFGSLEHVLHDKYPKSRSLPSKNLDWEARKKIAIGAARGLAFLHHSCIPHIIHRDMKSGNVLIDENLDARVSDFGMARLVNAFDTHLSVSTLAGTPGYVPPEYYQSFRCTTKGDIYSYGVVLLELLSGKKPIDPTEFPDSNLVGWAKQLVKEKKASEIFDAELIGENCVAAAELYQFLKIACECLDDRPLRRPTMIQVMAMFKELQNETESGSEPSSMEETAIIVGKKSSITEKELEV